MDVRGFFGRRSTPPEIVGVDTNMDVRTFLGKPRQRRVRRTMVINLNPVTFHPETTTTITLPVVQRLVPTQIPEHLRPKKKTFTPPPPKTLVPLQQLKQQKTAPPALFTYTSSPSPADLMVDLTPHSTTPLRVFLYDNNKLVREIEINPKQRRQKLYSWFQQFFEGGSEGTGTFLLDNYASKIYLAQDVPARRFTQTFRLSPNATCVFDALRQNIANRPPAKTKKTQYNRNTLLHKIDQLEAQYPFGVHQENLADIANALHVRIVLTDVLGNTLHTYGVHFPNKVYLQNTRFNHVDHFTRHDPTPVSQEQLNELYQQVKQSNKFYLVRNSTSFLTNLETQTASYSLEDPDQPIIDAVNEQIKHSYIDANKHPELNEFLKAGRIINSTSIVFSAATPDTKLYDMKNAFTQHRRCSFFEGFPDQIQVFASTNQIHKPGLYQVIVTRHTSVSRAFGLETGNTYVLPSPEIKYWRSQNVEFEITAGAWGSTLSDIEYPAEFITKKLYQRWTGKLSQQDNYRDTKYTFPCDKKFASHIKSLYPSTFLWENGEVSVQIPRKQVKTFHHVYAFITSYLRIQMLQQVSANTQAILCDGIYQTSRSTTGTKTLPDHFREKPLDHYPEFSTEWYTPTEPITPPNLFLSETTLLSGAGGTGKTHSILNNPQYVDVLYVTPTHELAQKFPNSTTIHKLIGQSCTPYRQDHRTPPVIFIDELTMIPKEFIDKALTLYPTSLIFLAGDIDEHRHYQCRSGNPTDYWKIWSPPPNFPIKRFFKDYRATTQQLRTQKLHLRAEMGRVFTDGGLKDTQRIRSYIETHYPTIALTDAINQATPDDIFMWSTHKVEGRIPDHFTKKGVHAYQGQTIPHPTKLFITLDFFEYAMPYTALSRATHHDQIVFVRTE